MQYECETVIEMSAKPGLRDPPFQFDLKEPVPFVSAPDDFLQRSLQVATSKKKQAADEAKKADKAQMRDSDKMQASAANAAAAAAFGSKAQKWGAWSTSAAKNPTGASQNPSSGGQKADAVAATVNEAGSASRETTAAAPRQEDGMRKSAITKPAAEGSQKKGFLPPSRVKAEMLSAKLPDLIAAMEGQHMYHKSALLYKLYEQLTD